MKLSESGYTRASVRGTNVIYARVPKHLYKAFTAEAAAAGLSGSLHMADILQARYPQAKPEGEKPVSSALAHTSSKPRGPGAKPAGPLIAADFEPPEDPARVGQNQPPARRAGAVPPPPPASPKKQ